MNGGIYVVADHSLVEQDRVLVVVAFPGHKADQRIFTQRNLAVAGRRTICQYLTDGNSFACADDWTLVEAGALVGAHELDDVEVFQLSLIGSDNDLSRVYAVNHAVDVGNNANAGVNCRFILHTGTNDWVLGLEKRNCLTLHVRTHQRTVGIVVLQEWDHRSCNRYNHLWRYVHVVYLFTLYDFNHVAVTNRYHLVGKGAFFGQRFVCLCDDELILAVSSHIFYFVEHLAGFFVHAAVWCLYKAVFVDSCKGSQVGDQTDVRTFRGLYRAHSSVVAVMYVTDLKSGTVTGKTARTQRRKTALVGQFCQRVVLVHKLRQRRGTEKFLDGSNHRTDVDQRLWGDDLHILCLCGHTLADDPLHSGEADAELVLQQLADRADSSVAQMVDVVGGADAVAQAAQIVDGRKDVVLDDVLWNQVICAVLNHLAQVLVGAAAVQNLAQHAEAYLLVDADFFQFILGVAGNIVQQVHHAVGDDLDNAVTAFEENGVHACALDLLCFCTGQHFVRLCHHFAGAAVDDWLGNNVSVDTGSDAQFFIVFITSNAGQVISSCVEEQGVQMALCAVHCRRLARTQFSVYFQQCFFGVVGAVLFDGRNDAWVISKEFQDLSVAGKSESTDEGGYRQLSVFINTNIENVVGVGLIFKPCAAVWNDCGGEQLFTGFVAGYSIINTGGTNQLGNNDTLCTVDDEGAAWCHDRKITHKDVLLFYLSGFLVQQACTNAQRSRIGRVTLFALFDGVFWGLVKTVVNKVEHQIALIVRNLGNILKYFLQSLLKKPFVGVFLHLDQVWHFQNLIDPRKAHSNIFTQMYRLNIHHRLIHSNPLI